MKKLYYILLFSILIISQTSCYDLRVLTSESDHTDCILFRKGSYQVKKNVMVLSAITKKNDTINFSKEFPCRITKDYIVGMPLVILPDSLDFDSIVYKKGQLKSIWKQGTKYSYLGINASGYSCVRMENETIPLTEIQQTQVRKSLKGGTAILTIGTAATIGLVTAAVISLQDFGFSD